MEDVDTGEAGGADGAALRSKANDVAFGEPICEVLAVPPPVEVIAFSGCELQHARAVHRVAMVLDHLKLAASV